MNPINIPRVIPKPTPTAILPFATPRAAPMATPIAIHCPKRLFLFFPDWLSADFSSISPDPFLRTCNSASDSGKEKYIFSNQDTIPPLGMTSLCPNPLNYEIFISIKNYFMISNSSRTEPSNARALKTSRFPLRSKVWYNISPPKVFSTKSASGVRSPVPGTPTEIR